MTIFNSYVNLPEGIIFTASVSHGCPPRSTTIVLHHPAWHRFTLQLPPQRVGSWMLQDATGEQPGMIIPNRFDKVYEQQLRLKCHIFKVLETS